MQITAPVVEGTGGGVVRVSVAMNKRDIVLLGTKQFQDQPPGEPAVESQKLSGGIDDARLIN